MNHLEAKTKDQLIELCKSTYWDRRGDANIFFSDATHSLASYLSPKAIHAFFILANIIDRRNVLFISEQELVDCLNWNKSDRFSYNSVKDILRELQSHGIVTFSVPCKEYSDVKRLVFHANLVWKGDIRLKEVLMRNQIVGWSKNQR